MDGTQQHRRQLWKTARGISIPAIVGLLLLACQGGGGDQAAELKPGPPGAGTNPPPPPLGAQAPAFPAALGGYKLLKASPELGNVGTPFTITGEGLPPNKPVLFVWATKDGFYDMKALPETVQFFERKFVDKRVFLTPTSGSVSTDAAGRFTASFAAPEDYGEVHDIYAIVDGQESGKSGFRIVRNVTISPTEGPVGTAITIKVDGLGWKPYESTLSVSYDNKYVGFIAATTTRGTTLAQIRAAGPSGKRTIDLAHASPTLPYLNYEQSPVAHIPNFRFTFEVTKDAGPPAATLDWPEPAWVSSGGGAAKTTASDVAFAPGVSATLSSQSGPILSKVDLQAKGLRPGDPVQVVWVTAVGNRIVPSGWSLKELPLAEAVAARDGTLSVRLEVPEDLGGWHAVRLANAGNVLGEIPFFVERSLVSITPTKVKAGDVFTVQVKGIGWTELDNGVAVTYDNAYMGYACGFNSQGDVTISFVATGGPGTHLIDLYPMIYQGQGKPPWSYQTPILSFTRDAPGLTLGYRLPAFRLAIEVVD